MTVSVGQIIQASHYNYLANLCNRVFADNYPTSEYFARFSGSTIVNATECNAIFVIHETDYPTTSPGIGPFNLTPIPQTYDFLVVQIGDDVKVNTGYSINYDTGTITFTTALPPATRVVVYNRYTHRFGYGNSAVINNLAATDIVEAVHTNGIIDRTNAILTHVGDTGQLTNVSTGTDITANDGNFIENVYQTNVLQNDVHLTVAAASAINSASFTRQADWSNNLEGIFAYTFNNYNDARYFFNSGGEIRWSLDMTGNVNNEGFSNWLNIVQGLGTVRMNHNNSLQSGTGGISNGKGFYHLTTDWQTVFSSATPGSTYGGGYGGYGDYSNLRAIFYARIVEVGNTHQIQIKVVMDDSQYHVDPIQGTTTFFASLLQPDDITKNNVTYSVNTPIVSVVEDFNTANDL